MLSMVPGPYTISKAKLTLLGPELGSLIVRPALARLFPKDGTGLKATQLQSLSWLLLVNAVIEANVAKIPPNPFCPIAVHVKGVALSQNPQGAASVGVMATHHHAGVGGGGGKTIVQAVAHVVASGYGPVIAIAPTDTAVAVP